MQIKEIKTIEDVNAFLKFLIIDLELNFHPDDPFTDYQNRAGEKLFTEREAWVLEVLLEQAFFVAQEVDIDLYGLSLDISLDHLSHLKMAA